MAGNPIGNLVITLDFDGSKFEQGMNRAKSELSSYGRSTTTALKYARDMNYTQDASVRALNNLQVEYRGTNKMIEQYQDKMKKMRAEGSYDQTQYANHQKEVARLTDNLYNLSSTYDEVSKQAMYQNSAWTKSGQVFKSVGQGMMNTGQALQGIGDGITRIGALATTGGTIFAKSAIDFEKGLTEVQKTTNATGAQMEIFEGQIRDMATTMPIAHAELTELASIAGQLGVPQGEIADFTQTMAMLGTATTMSASQASESFARFTNITGSGTETINNLGSALVHLGNNMATTESEIMAMATQLAGTLTTVGIAEPDILALSASMSSLGITAERGASSISKFFVDLSTSVSEGGEQLGLFAEVAGVTSEQFSTMFKQDALGAFQAFIEGLGQIDDTGGDAIATLEELGISEVRLRDTLLRLAQGHGVLAEGIKLSNDAYIEGTRHIDEYDLMAGTTASQWQIARNQFQDVAITIGQELLPVIIDLLDNSDGIIDMAKGVAEWFGNLDDELKENIVKWGALSVVLGPVISGLASLTIAGGGVLTFIGQLQDKIGWLTTLRNFTPGGITSGLSNLGTISGTTAGQVGLLSRALGLLTSPAGIAVASIVALYGAYRVLNSDAVEAYNAMKEFPDIEGITAEQADNLRESADELDNIARSIGNVQTAGDISFIAEDVRTIGDRISELNVEKIDNLREALALLPENVQENLKQSVEDTIAGLEAQVTKAEEVVQRINELSQKDELTEGEQYEAGLLSEQLLNSYALANSENHQQYIQTRDYLLADVEDMGQKRLRTRIEHDKEYLAHIKSSQQAELDALYDLYQETTMTESEYLQNRQLIQDGYNLQRQDGIKRLLRSENELFERLIDHASTSEQREQYKQAQQAWLQEMADMYGVTVEDIQRMINQIEVDRIPEKLIDGTNQTTEELNEIARRWSQTMNGFAEETGIALEDINLDNISENLDAFIAEITEAGLTWDDLLLLEKEGIISLDTLNFLQQILESEEIWEQMKLAEKEASINIIGLEELEEIVTLFGVDFASLTDEQKQALIETRGAKELSDLLYLYGIWDREDVPAKQAVIETDNALMEFQPVLEILGIWDDYEFLGK